MRPNLPPQRPYVPRAQIRQFAIRNLPFIRPGGIDASSFHLSSLSPIDTNYIPTRKRKREISPLKEYQWWVCKSSNHLGDYHYIHI